MKGKAIVCFLVVLFLISMFPAIVQALTVEQDYEWNFSGSTRENSDQLTGSDAGYYLTAGQTLNVTWSGQSSYMASAMGFYLLNSYQLLGWEWRFNAFSIPDEHTHNGYIYKFDSWGSTVIYSIPSTDRYYVIFICRGYYGDLVPPSIHVHYYIASAYSTPSATLTPSSATMDRGQSQLLACTVSGGTPPYTYQWYLDEVIIPGTTSNTWTFTSTSAGIFAINVKVTDSDGYTDYSNFALMYVNLPPVVSISPSSVVMDVGQSQLFTSTVSYGTSPYSYQWYLNGAQINGATSSNYVFTPPVPGSYIQIHVQVTDSVGVQATSNTATVTVNSGLSAFVSPTSVVMDVGQSQLFTSTVSGGTSPYSCQWYLSSLTSDNVIVNSGFETGDFAGWNQEGINDAQIRDDEHHSGSYSCASYYDYYGTHQYLPFRITQKLPSVSTDFVTNVGCWYKYGTSVDWLKVNYTDGSVSSIGLGNSAYWTYVTLNLAANKTVDSLMLERTASFDAVICIDDVDFIVNGSPVSGATGSTWTYTPGSLGSYKVYVQVTDNVGFSVNSNIANVTVNPVPSVTISPASVVMNVTESQLFTSTVSDGTGPYYYQWYLDGGIVTGATSATWAFTPSVAGYYTVYVKITDSVGVQATSNIANVTVNSSAGSLIHDVAVTNVTSYKTVVGLGCGGNISVTVENHGNYTETVNLTIYANATSVESQNVTLSAGDSVDVIFTWNTTSFAYGNYTLSAYAWPVPGETDTSNNQLVGGQIMVSIPGDINGDGTVDIYDAIRLAGAINSTPSSPRWDPNADINNDGIVDIYDALLLAGHFGQTLPNP